MNDATEAPGWGAIDEALERLYPEQEPKHWATQRGIDLGDGLQGVSAYRANGHWHYVSYGLSELFAKESEFPDQSGFGYELTFRVARPTDEAPLWPATLLERLAQTVWDGSDYAIGDRVGVGGPITGNDDTALDALAVVLDPELGEIDTPHGRLAFKQLVGITAAEWKEMKRTSTEQVLRRLQANNPLLVTDAHRATP
jgi:hypothetical protein